MSVQDYPFCMRRCVNIIGSHACRDPCVCIYWQWWSENCALKKLSRITGGYYKLMGKGRCRSSEGIPPSLYKYRATIGELQTWCDKFDTCTAARTEVGGFGYVYFTSVDAARAAKREMQHDGYDGPNGSHNCNSGCEITHVLTPKCLVKTAPSGSR